MLLLVLLAATVMAPRGAAAADSPFIHAVKNLLFGSGNGSTPSEDGVVLQPHQSVRSYHQYPPYTIPAIIAGGAPGAQPESPPSAVCTLPQQIGTGPYRIPRWFYNPSRMRCELFYWSGCCGNANNFQTFQTCQQLCEVDACSLPREYGVGSSKLIRFAFNPVTRLCEEFVFFGAGGNRNNFPTLEECQDQCPESPNVCSVPTQTPPVQCIPGAGCSASGFCHVGASPQSTVCCPKPLPVDRCHQPLNVGVGNANLQRWYYNPLTQACTPCVYHGLQGNENNFVTQQECEMSCLAVNPCRVGVPYRNAQMQTIQCSAINPSVCPAGYYCHVGADPTTTVCCQALVPSLHCMRQGCMEPETIITRPCTSEGGRCTQKMEQGEGKAALTRFYFSIEQRACYAFNYLGGKGNENNFASREECERSCPIWTNPCGGGHPAPLSPVGCHETRTCSAGSYCHVGYDAATTVCCPSLALPRCSQNLHSGSGKASIQRYFYNSARQACELFVYTGIGGNENNFESLLECERACPVNPCPSSALLRDGQFVSCQSGMNTCPSGHFCHIGGDSSICCVGTPYGCSLSLVEGEGGLALPRFYFDNAKKDCVPFTYRGRRGNSNNFRSKEECSSECSVREDPCPITYSSLSRSARGVSCSAKHVCPDNHWCHVGPSSETTVCCPNVLADPCMAPPRNPGTGTVSLTRWTFEPSTRRCVSFIYKGLRGNANNFLTREACEGKCPVFENPCKVGEPYSVSGFYTACSPTQPCPSSHYCHIGNLNNFCCPVIGGDPCGQPADRGLGRSQLARWYWDANTQCCLPFSYCGLKGTQNNFLSKQDCERTCYELEEPPAPPPENPCVGEPETVPPDNQYLHCSLTNNTCSATFWCHFGATDQTTVCCPNRVLPPDICQEPLVEGSGGASLPRWHFDPTIKRCIQFIYQGKFGNQNNFLTLQDCEQTCPVYVNVCPSGEPLLDPSGQPRTCTFNGGQCGPAHWCHLGLLPAEFQCCPGAPVNPAACTGLPEAPGVLGAPAPAQERWYFDESTLTCKPFIYNGRQGNQNNFLTQADCEATCPVFDNPCPVPIVLPPTSCSPMGDTCNPAGWCHVGATPEATICCPNDGDPCTLPQNRGSGNALLDRWFYNAQTGNCQPFTYTGMRGNSNNFLSREACEERCGPNPCFEGRPFAGSDGRVQTCSASANLNTCPINYWCHLGQDMATTVCCPGASTNVCNLPMSTGEGNANLERFYFDQSTRTCRPFIYNGLKGNQNNFASLRSCQLACQPLDNPCIGQPATTAAGQVLFCSVTNKDSCPVNFWCHVGATPETTVCCPGATNPCSVPLAPGTGNAGLARWYYNPDDRECVPFQYNGKRGNQNNFESQSECQRTCPEQLCLLSIDRGACGGRQTRYAFNRQTNQCIAFEYTGCGGNLNNFISMADCMATCGNIGFR